MFTIYRSVRVTIDIRREGLEMRSRERIVVHRHSLKQLLTPLNERFLLESKRFVSAACSLLFSEHWSTSANIVRVVFKKLALLESFYAH